MRFAIRPKTCIVWPAGRDAREERRGTRYVHRIHARWRGRDERWAVGSGAWNDRGWMRMAGTLMRSRRQAKMAILRKPRILSDRRTWGKWSRSHIGRIRVPLEGLGSVGDKGSPVGWMSGDVPGRMNDPSWRRQVPRPGRVPLPPRVNWRRRIIRLDIVRRGRVGRDGREGVDDGEYCWVR